MASSTLSKTEDTASVGLTLAVIGCGTMGTAILSGVLDSCIKTDATGATPRFSKFIATVNSETSAENLTQRFSENLSWIIVSRDNLNAIKKADVILLAFKPYMIDTVLSDPEILSLLSTKLIISVLVGSPPSKIENAIYTRHSSSSRQTLYIKRAMPNIGANYGQSMTVIESSPNPIYPTNSSHEALTDWIFLQIGKIQHVPPELFDVGGVLAGASGALLSVAFDGILDGAVSQGLKRSDATKILTQSLVSLATLLQNGEHPAVLREKFSSPKGTTIAGLLSLEEDRARWAYSRATIASSERSKEIGEVKK